MFRDECKSILLKFLEKFLSKSPLQYSLTSYVSALNPKGMAQDPKVANQKMKKILDILVSKRKYNINDCKKVLGQYDDFISEGLKNGCLNAFSRDTKNSNGKETDIPY